MDEEEFLDKPKGGHKLRWILAAVAVILAVAALFLRIDTVTVEGSRHYSAAEFENMLFPEYWDRNPLVFLFRENTGGSIRVPFVERYTVEMEGLSKVHIIVYEKEIAGYVEHNGLYIYFDQDGMAVESSVEMMEDVPKVLGLSGGRIQLGYRLPVSRESIFQAVLSVSQFLQSHSIVWGETEAPLVKLVDAVYVDESANTTCILEDLQIYLGGTRNLEEKLLIMSDMLPKLYGRGGTVYLDNYSESQSGTSYVFKEGSWKLNVSQVEADDWEPDPVPETTPEETLEAIELNASEEEEAEDGSREEVEAEILQPEDDLDGLTVLDEEEEEDRPPVDGDGVDDIPDDYVGGDGYGH